MTRDEIIKLAQKCNLIGMRPHLDGIYQESLEHFAALVASAESEKCAKLAAWILKMPENDVSSAIRAMGNE